MNNRIHRHAADRDKVDFNPSISSTSVVQRIVYPNRGGEPDTHLGRNSPPLRSGSKIEPINKKAKRTMKFEKDSG